jgi:sugar (pentulose or hexulose) kinase
VGVGLHPDFDTAVAAMTRIRDTFEPIPENQRVYDEIYRGVYLKMYSQLKPLYEELYRIASSSSH